MKAAWSWIAAARPREIECDPRIEFRISPGCVEFFDSRSPVWSGAVEVRIKSEGTESSLKAEAV
jgi:hypothetical protein